MFDVGFAELFLLALIGLIVLGPERLPAVARTIGGFMRKARASWASLRNTIESELAEADITAPIKDAAEELRRIGKDMNTDLPDLSDIPGFAAEKRESTAKQANTEPDSDRQEDLFGESLIETKSSEEKLSEENPGNNTNSGKGSNV
jgi:sec-independent protein translocase protein TatB